MFNIAEFKQNGLVNGGARPSLFQVIMSQDLTNSLNFDNTIVAQLPFVCRGSQLPASMLQEIRVPYMGRTIKVAGDREFEDWTITIMNDEDFGVRSMFESWQNSINSLESNVRETTLDTENYKVDFNVRQFDKTGTIIRSYKMVGAFPTRISGIELDWEAQNQIEVFQVTFAYDYWLPDEADEAQTTVSYYSAATTPTTI